MRRIHFMTAPAFFISIFLAGSLLFSPIAHAACAAPVANAGALEWFTADTKFKYCDGTNWTTIGSAGLWTLNGTDIHYTPGNVGVGWTAPVVALDVNGSIRMGDSGTACNSTYEGTLRYNTTTDSIDYCDGTAWASIAGAAMSSCAVQEYTTPGNYSYTVVAGCENLMLEAYGAGGGGAYNGQGGGGGGSSRIDNNVPTTLALGAGGGGGGYDFSAVGGGGGGGYGKKIVTLTAGDNLNIVVGGGGQSACTNDGGAGGSPAGGVGGSSGGQGGNSTYGGAGGGDSGNNGGDTTHGGGGGGGSAGLNGGSVTVNGGAGGADYDQTCGATTNGGPCGGLGEGGGGGAGLGDVILLGLSGDRFAPGTAANGGPGTGAMGNSACPTTGGNGKVVIRPL